MCNPSAKSSVESSSGRTFLGHEGRRFKQGGTLFWGGWPVLWLPWGVEPELCLCSLQELCAHGKRFLPILVPTVLRVHFPQEHLGSGGAELAALSGALVLSFHITGGTGAEKMGYLDSCMDVGRK